MLTWAPGNALNAYASFSQGFRGGFAQGPSVQSLYPNYTPVDPDTLTNYEIGVKGQAFNRRLSYEAALFYQDWQDAQQILYIQLPPLPGSTAGLFTPAAVNGASLSGTGASFAISAMLSDNLALDLNAGWNKMAWDEDVRDGDGALIFAKGSRANFSPEYSLGGSLKYSWDLGRGFRASSSVSHTYKAPQNKSADGATQSDPIPITDLRFSVVAPENWTVTLYVDNATDENVRMFEVTGVPQWNVHPHPRTIGLQMEYRY